MRHSARYVINHTHIHVLLLIYLHVRQEQVVEFSSSEKTIEANQGSASRRNWLGKLMNLREEKAKPNMYVDSIHIIIENMCKQINNIIQVCVSMLTSFHAVRRKTSGTSRIFHSMFHSNECNKILGCRCRWWYVITIFETHITHSLSRTNRQGSTEHVNTSRVSSTRESSHYVQSWCVASPDDRPGQSNGLCVFGMGRRYCKRL